MKKGDALLDTYRPKIGNTGWYVASWDDEWVALLSFSAAALKCGVRDRWIGWNFRHQYGRLSLIANNSRVLILPHHHHKNLASRVLSLCQRRLQDDWVERFGYPLLLLETFVDPTRFVGTIYRAANWWYVGDTRGYQRIRGGHSRMPHRPKRVFVQPLQRNARGAIGLGRGVGVEVMDAWNLYPMLNNYLFAAEAAQPLTDIPALPTARGLGVKVFERAGIAVGHTPSRVVAVGLARGGSVKMWDRATKALFYEDCGYTFKRSDRYFVSQAESSWAMAAGEFLFDVTVDSEFKEVSSVHFSPMKFIFFRIFTLTLGRNPTVARWLKQTLVHVLIRARRSDPAKMRRRIAIAHDGLLTIEDELNVISDTLTPLPRQVPFHMGSARYAAFEETLGARVACPQPVRHGASCVTRKLHIPSDT